MFLNFYYLFSIYIIAACFERAFRSTVAAFTCCREYMTTTTTATTKSSSSSSVLLSRHLNFLLVIIIIHTRKSILQRIKIIQRKFQMVDRLRWEEITAFLVCTKIWACICKCGICAHLKWKLNMTDIQWDRGQNEHEFCNEDIKRLINFMVLYRNWMLFLPCPHINILWRSMLCDVKATANIRSAYVYGIWWHGKFHNLCWIMS